MATKRSVEDILDDSLPGPSKEMYQKKFKQFIEFIGEDRRPTETDYLQYFDHLHLWQTY